MTTQQIDHSRNNLQYCAVNLM